MLVENHDETVTARPMCCAHCRASLHEDDHRLAARYNKIDLPKVTPVVTQVGDAARSRSASRR